MESRWYLFPGQTLENTRISDRAHALHITSAAWGGITQHLDRKKRIQEAIDKEKAHKEALKRGSEEMTKNWADSTQNLHLKKEQERKNKGEKNIEDRLKEFYAIRAEQDVVRQAYVEKIKKEMFVSSGYPRELTSALILSETLYERDKQKEFNEMLRKHDEEVKKKCDDAIIASDEQQRKEDAEEKKCRLERERQTALVIKEQMKEVEESRKAQTRAHIERETFDRIKAAEEAELLKKFELDEKLRKKREAALEKKKAIEIERKRHQVLAKEEAEMEKATEFYAEAKRRIDCLMKQKAKEMKDEEIRQHELLASKVASIQEAKDAAEDERIAKVLAEREAQEKARAEHRAAMEAQAIRDRMEDRKKYLQRKEEKRQFDEEIKKWEMINRFKTAEAMKEYNEKNRREKWQKILEYRKELLNQMADDEEIKRQEKEIDDILNRVSFNEADRRFFEYANEVMMLAWRKKRPTYPIEKVIAEYRKVNNLLPRPKRYCSHKCPQ